MPENSTAEAPDRRPGILSLVATPIGNLEDLSARARRALETADVVACEDTRHSGRLLAHLGIKKRLVSMHDHNERRRVPQLLETLEDGQRVVVISDAGTPLISDPGFPLVRDAAARGIRIEPIPGPSAILVALVSSALPPYPFTFGGFAPPKSGKRRTFLRRLGDLGHTFLYFETPHRLLRSLADAELELGSERPVAVCRELTKLHEEVVRGSLGEVRRQLEARPGIKGEIVVVLGPG